MAGAIARTRLTTPWPRPTPPFSIVSGRLAPTLSCTPRKRMSACPHGQIGNSEVGHMNLGAGRVVFQDLPMIDKAFAEGELDHNPAMNGFIAALKQSGGSAHLMGLLSPGGVHSHQSHFAALAKALSAAKVPVVDPRLPRWPRRAAAQRPRAGRRVPEGYRRPARRHLRHDRRPLLRDGPRQALGTGGAGL